MRPDAPRVLCNRGANGIDGTVSSAFGAAAVSAGPVVLLIGDVALAYDVGGLLAARRLGLALTIVLVNNDGGGIFEFLPIAGERDAFEEHVATPHGLDFAHAAALYGCAHERVRTVAELRDGLARALAGAGTTILEVRTDRAANRALHRALADAVLSAELSAQAASGGGRARRGRRLAATGGGSPATGGGSPRPATRLARDRWTRLARSRRTGAVVGDRAGHDPADERARGRGDAVVVAGDGRDDRVDEGRL